MIIETERLLLRPWDKEDAQDLYLCARDPAIGPPCGWAPHTSLQESQTVLAQVLCVPETYAIVPKEWGRPVGCVSVMQPPRMTVPQGKAQAEIGYWLGVPFWGRGFVPEAVRALLRHCFEDLGCDSVWCGYYEGNEKSRRVQEKCGFVYDHTEENKLCSQLEETRTEHCTRLGREKWAQDLAAALQR